MDERRLRCAEPPPDGLIEGIDQFNRREFFECHETLEALWIKEPGPVRELYQGILQVGVGFYHAGRGNYPGAIQTLRRGIERLRVFSPECHGVVVDELVRQAESAAVGLAALGPTRIDEFDPRLIPVIQLRSDPLAASPHRRVPASGVPRLWTRGYIFLCLAVLLCYTSQWLLMSTLPLYVRDLGASVVVAGLVLAAFSATSFTMRPIVGFLTDTRSRLGVLTAGTLILGTTGMAFAIPGLAVTFLANAVRGIGWASINTASYTVLLKVAPVDRRGEASSYYSVATSTAISFAPVVALWLVAPPQPNYLAVFVLAGLSAFAATGVVRMLARTSPDLGQSDMRPGEQRLQLSSLIDRRVLLASALLLSYTVTNPSTSSFIPLYAREIGIENSGAYFGVGGIVSIAASVLLARFLNQASRGLWLVVGFVLSLLGVVGLLLAADIWFLTAAGVIVVLGAAVLNPILLAVAIDRADTRRPGAAMATFSLAYQLGNGLGAPLAGLLIEGFGFQGMFVGSVVALSAGLLATGFKWRSLGNPVVAVSPLEA